MNVTIYQIDPALDEDNLIFQNWNGFLQKGCIRPPAECYRSVYNGEMDADTTPDDVFEKFNTAIPKDYAGRSLSVSDVIELQKAYGKSSFFFCDTFAFQELAFEKSSALAARVSDIPEVQRIADVVTAEYAAYKYEMCRKSGTEVYAKAYEIHLVEEIV
ncbi:MAG: hypothetical protein LBT44_02960, partial [Clostridiales bacterium]|nr:hypothetical protein [Clostridiales bacterium]